MFAGSPLSSKTSPSTSPHPPLSPSAQSDTEGPEEGKPTSVASSFSLPCWATQALCDLARCETDLRRLREQQVSEAQTTSRGVERALLGAQREEHRLLERVEQDHRDVQRKLEQVQRENAAAIRVGQTLVDQRLRKVIKLRELIKKTSGEANRDGEGDQRRDQLLKGIADLLQPWEVMLALKRVSFKPSAQPNAVTFGEIKVQDHNVHFPIGGCGQQRQMCSLHSTEAYSGNHVDQGGEGENIPDEASPGQGQVLCPGSKPKYSTTSSGNLRVVRKLRLSARSDEESGEDMKLQSPRLHHWPPKQVPCERDSSQEEECESPTSECKGDELFVAVPSLRQRESEEDVFGHLQNGAITQFPSQRARRQQELSPSLEQGHHEQCSWSMHQYNNQNQRTNTGRNRSSRETSQFGTQACPQSPREPLTKQGNQLLRGRSFSQLSASSDDQAHNRPPSPADSVDSGYTFIVSSPRDYTNSLCPTARLSRSTVDLTNCSRPLSGTRADQSSLWTVTKSRLSSLSSRSFQRKNVSQTTSCPSHGMLCPKNTHQYNSHSCRVSRSLSMSVINSSSQKRLNHQETGRKNTLNENRLWGERSEPALLELEEDAEQARLVRQFGKQGSGRADLTLPSGVHATPQGQLFLVDCGNARVQVTDSHGNVLQQVSSTGNDLGGSLRRCRNYFDVAVNAKGLIALSCAAERALLIFSRHGRLLQTFGGGPYIAGVPRDELEAPRGVTVTQRDEFLVADIRKGTLTALKLEPKTGSRLERTVVTGFHRPYLVAACLHSGLVAVSERGSETNQEPCVKILGPGWDTLRILGVCSSLGPVLSCPWGLCIDKDGDVLVADWAEKHRVVLYPAEGTGRVMVSDGLSSPRGLALLPNDLLVVSDSMHHCIKIYQYK